MVKLNTVHIEWIDSGSGESLNLPKDTSIALLIVAYIAGKVVKPNKQHQSIHHVWGVKMKLSNLTKMTSDTRLLSYAIIVGV